MFGGAAYQSNENIPYSMTWVKSHPVPALLPVTSDRANSIQMFL